MNANLTRTDKSMLMIAAAIFAIGVYFTFSPVTFYSNSPVQAESMPASYISNYHGRESMPVTLWLKSPTNQSRCWLYSYTSRYNDSEDFRGDNCWIVEGESPKPVTRPESGNNDDTVYTVSNDAPPADNPVIVNNPVITDNPVNDTPQDDQTVQNEPESEEPPVKEDKPEKEPKQEKEKNNNGHGNNNDGIDCSNPGRGPKNEDSADNSAPIDDEGHGGGNNKNKDN